MLVLLPPMLNLEMNLAPITGAAPLSLVPDQVGVTKTMVAQMGSAAPITGTGMPICGGSTSKSLGGV